MGPVQDLFGWAANLSHRAGRGEGAGVRPTVPAHAIGPDGRDGRARALLPMARQPLV
jgi:hypothetical protein